jgi:hypothetical protein
VPPVARSGWTVSSRSAAATWWRGPRDEEGRGPRPPERGPAVRGHHDHQRQHRRPAAAEDAGRPGGTDPLAARARRHADAPGPQRTGSQRGRSDRSVGHHDPRRDGGHRAAPVPGCGPAVDGAGPVASLDEGQHHRCPTPARRSAHRLADRRQDRHGRWHQQRCGHRLAARAGRPLGGGGLPERLPQPARVQQACLAEVGRLLPHWQQT